MKTTEKSVMIFVGFEYLILTILLLVLCPSSNELTIDRTASLERRKRSALSDDIINETKANRTGFVRLEQDMILSNDRFLKLRNQIPQKSGESKIWQEIEQFAPKVPIIRNPTPRNFARDVLLRWPGGVIPYEFADDAAFDETDMTEFDAALSDFHNFTCLKFRKRIPKTDTTYLFIINGDGCYSHVGRVLKKQELSLAPGCRRKGIMQHELMHSIGFFHEQSRPDRDQYIDILKSNVIPWLLHNFDKNALDQADSFGSKYDYLSIMHYGQTAFSARGKITIKTADSRYQSAIGQRQILSFNDVRQINQAYKCFRGCPVEDGDCGEDGFVGKDCMCWCPPPRKPGVSLAIMPTVPAVKCERYSAKPTKSSKQKTTTPYKPERETTTETTKTESLSTTSPIPSTSTPQILEKLFPTLPASIDNSLEPENDIRRNSLEKIEPEVLNLSLAKSESKIREPTFETWKFVSIKGIGLSNLLTTTFPTSKRSSKLTSQSGCNDFVPKCYQWALNGDCFKMERFMTNYCPDACGLCGAGLVKTTTVGPRMGSCYDLESRCEIWKRFGLCRIASYNDWMGRKCAKSCGYCHSMADDIITDQGTHVNLFHVPDHVLGGGILGGMKINLIDDESIKSPGASHHFDQPAFTTMASRQEKFSTQRPIFGNRRNFRLPPPPANGEIITQRLAARELAKILTSTGNSSSNVSASWLMMPKLRPDIMCRDWTRSCQIFASQGYCQPAKSQISHDAEDNTDLAKKIAAERHRRRILMLHGFTALHCRKSCGTCSEVAHNETP